ncbi:MULTISPECIES: thymidylate synthase [Cyanophyceae]|uniref:thymidylate synthase n=1 Tax=Cyanophyceae TaxID=3028117 RepID=UPI0016842B2A|nr:thymidylate synthase [Trichocoleus sp. FACHB-40]MBD2006175.1 thymidylate synthase [Trichocoleus sp. FACHB-40]
MTATGRAIEFQYKPLHKPNQLICGKGQTAVITGWTVKQAIAKHLQPHEYAVIGQLYSPTRGISFLIRNLLANPHVRFLVILNATKEDRNAGGGTCLLDFFRHGFAEGKTDTGRRCWTINSRIPGYIDIEISDSALKQLRKYVRADEAESIELAVDLVKSHATQGVSAPWGSKLEFPNTEVVPTVLPGQLYGHRIEGKTIAQTWVKIIHRIKTTGIIRPTGYDGYIQELINLMAVVTDEPDNFYFPEPNYLPVDPETIKNYIPQILEDAPYVEGIKYTYSQRLRSWFGRDQIEDVIQKLIGEIDAASAVMNLWDSGGNINRREDGTSDHQHSGSPCLNHIWVRVVNGNLSLTATLRSNDMFGAWVANAMGLRALQKHITDEITRRSDYKLKMGPLITISQSAHIYDDTWENADNLIQQQYASICKQQDYYDPSGNFLIEITDSQIAVTQTTPGSGEAVACYFGKNPLKLVREICAASPAIRPDHAAYLGMELQKAAECLKTGKQYIQDRE